MGGSRSGRTRTSLSPPFVVFVNRNFNDEKRLKDIVKLARLPKGQWNIPNFLRKDEKNRDSIYHVSINSLGFRGPERSVQKGRNVFRIVLLGSYPAFGHAVSDEETYASVLEKSLNKNAIKPWSFEVWNAGQQGSTAIMGLARLKEEIFDYHPDLILLDFGWIEPYTYKDIGPEDVKKLRSRDFSSLLVFFIKACWKESFKELLLCQQFRKKMAGFNLDSNIQGFRNALLEFKKIGEERKMPMVFMKEVGVMISPDLFRELEEPPRHFWFLDMTKFDTRQPQPSEIDEFWSKSNWLSEMGYSKEEVVRNDPSAMYRADAIQLNKFGYQLVAEQIEAKLQELHKNGELEIPLRR